MSKPNIAPTPPPPSDLLSRLSTFLPQLSAANETLQREIAEAGGNAEARNIEHVRDDEETYIEMNLGLGVLEEIRSTDDDSSSETEQDPIAAALNPTPAKKPVIQLVEDDDAPHGIKRNAPPDSDESDSEVEGKEELEKIISASKRHDKKPRGKPSIEEVAE